jgi:hypothetical protein
MLMARRRKPAPIPLSEVRAGDAFLAPLSDGRLCVCRVLQTEPDNSQVLVAVSPWIGTQPPDVSEPQLREILCLTHHSYQGQHEVVWVTNPVPATFTRLGEIPPTEADRVLTCSAWTGWESCPHQVFLQWRWDHERDQVLAEDEAQRQAEEAAREAERQAYKPLPAQTLEELRQQTPFPHWSGYVEPAVLRASRRIIRELIDVLIEQGPNAPEPNRLDEIRLCVERFNALDEEHSFIETVEREDIFELIGELGDLVGLDDYEESLISDRDW